MTKEEIKIGTQFVYKGIINKEDRDVPQTITNVISDIVYSIFDDNESSNNKFHINAGYIDDCETLYENEDSRFINLVIQLIESPNLTTVGQLSLITDFLKQSVNKDKIFLLSKLKREFITKDVTLVTLLQLLIDNHLIYNVNKQES